MQAPACTVKDLSREIFQYLVLEYHPQQVQYLNTKLSPDLLLLVLTWNTDDGGGGKAALFANGGKVGITEFSWNPTNMKAFTSKAECKKDNKGEACFRQNPGRGSQDYFIPT